MDWLLRLNAVFNNCSDILRRQVHYRCVFRLSNTSSSHNIFYQLLAAFLHRLLANWRKTNDAIHSVFCQTSEVRCSNSQFLDWQPASLPTELAGLGVGNGAIAYNKPIQENLCKWKYKYWQVLILLWQKEKLLTLSNYLLCHVVFKSLLHRYPLYTRKD